MAQGNRVADWLLLLPLPGRIRSGLKIAERKEVSTACCM